MSWRTPTQSLPQEVSPRAVFYRLFGQGDTDSERAAIVKKHTAKAGASKAEITSKADAAAATLKAARQVLKPRAVAPGGPATGLNPFTALTPSPESRPRRCAG